MNARSRWTENELAQEIRRLDELIANATRRDDERSRCVASYLRQMRKDRRDMLAVMRLHRYVH